MRTDGELVAAVADGDRGAFRELHDRHVAWVTSRVARRCADRDVVAETVQDTFVAIWKGASKWDGRGEPAAWISLPDLRRRRPSPALVAARCRGGARRDPERTRSGPSVRRPAEPKT